MEQMSSDECPDWLPVEWSVSIRKSGAKKVKTYIDPDGHKCYSKPQVFDYLKKTGKPLPMEKTPIAADPAIDLSVDPNAPHTDEVPESAAPGGPPTKLTPRTTARKSITRDLSEDFYTGVGPSSGPPSQKRHKGDSSWLPAGWTVEEKFRKGGRSEGMRYKMYRDPISGQKFFSKPQVLTYLAKTNRSAGGPEAVFVEPISATPISAWQEKPTTEPDSSQIYEDTEIENITDKMTERSDQSKGTEASRESPNGLVEEPITNESGIQNPKPLRSITGGLFSPSISSPKEDNSDWLPDGWLVDVRYKASGAKFKVYKYPASGKKFYSKPQVLSYLGIPSTSNSKKRKEHSSPNSTPAVVTSNKSSVKKKDKSRDSDYQEIITTSVADGLPPGWIKELRTRIYGTHKRNDPFYTDPDTGYIFRSRKDALRFLESGDVNICAIRPKIKDKDGNEVFVYTNDVKKPTTGDAVSTKVPEENHNNEPVPAAADSANHGVTQSSSPPVNTPARASKRQKGKNPEDDEVGQEKQGTGVNLEKAPDDNGNLSFDIPEDDNWADQCIDFAVKTLTNEIMFNGEPVSGGFQDENGGVETTGVKETTPTKVN